MQSGVVVGSSSSSSLLPLFLSVSFQALKRRTLHFTLSEDNVLNICVRFLRRHLKPCTSIQIFNCRSCITESVRHKAMCPICKGKVTRRDIAADVTMDRVVQAFQNLEANKGITKCLYLYSVPILMTTAHRHSPEFCYILPQHPQAQIYHVLNRGCYAVYRSTYVSRS